jgi:predicted RNA-binding Zn-ribbon protein involved in translation (DUF1610 family)
MAYLASNREKFTVPADGVVDVRVELVGDLSPKARVWLQCIPCGDELQENKERSLLECPECGYEMTSGEAEALARKHVDALRERFNLRDIKSKKGILWRFTSWFVNRKRLPAPKS